MEVLTEKKLVRQKTSRVAVCRTFTRSLSKENQVRLLRNFLSVPDSDGESSDLWVGGGKTILRILRVCMGGFATAFLCPLSLIKHHFRAPGTKQGGKFEEVWGHLEYTAHV